jgi:polyhydroxyalkanoate synthesis regulator protein
MAGWFRRSGSDDVDDLEKAINELSDEQRKLVSRFEKAMSGFATERSLDACLEALNVSIQLANTRGKLSDAWEHYARIMEGEVARQTTPAKSDQSDS